MLSDVQVQRYLERIGYTGELSCTAGTLDALVKRHQRSIPFETISIHRADRVPDISLDVIYDKMIEREFGGYCFELNKLFEALLVSLGFEARPTLSRAVRGRGPEARMPINHRGIVVRLPEGDYSVDVGFGGPMPSGALLLADGVEQTIDGEVYVPVRTDSCWWNIERITRAASDFFDDGLPVRRQVELELCEAKVEERDFAALNFFFAQPGTLFRDVELVNLRTDGGYKGYRDGVLTIRRGAEKTLVEFDDPEKANAALKEHFGLNF